MSPVPTTEELRSIARAVRVLHLDDWVVGVHKPAGLLVHITNEAPDRFSLQQAVRDRIGRRIWPVHRLDRGTSGIVVFGLSPADAHWLHRALRAGQKRYLALVRGDPPDEGVIDKPLRDEKGIPREARTRYRVVERFVHQSLVEVAIETGRRHQIRRHLSAIAHQILGDRSHGKGRLNALFREKYGLERPFLHAALLRFRHEPLAQDVVIRDPLPPDLEAVLAALRAERDGGADSPAPPVGPHEEPPA